MATTLISSSTKIEMSKAIPSSVRRLRLLRRALISIAIASLIRIDSAAAPGQLHKARLASCRVRDRGGNDQRDNDVADVFWRIVHSCTGTENRSRRRRLIFAKVRKDRHRIAR